MTFDKWTNLIEFVLVLPYVHDIMLRRTDFCKILLEILTQLFDLAKLQQHITDSWWHKLVISLWLSVCKNNNKTKQKNRGGAGHFIYCFYIHICNFYFFHNDFGIIEALLFICKNYNTLKKNKFWVSGLVVWGTDKRGVTFHLKYETGLFLEL